MATTTMGMHHHGKHGAAASAGYFLLHLLEMFLAMMAGMVIYGILFFGLLTPAGYATTLVEYPLLKYSVMSIFMTVPMVALMRFQGHSWQGSAEMAAAMVVPTIALAALVQLGGTPYLPSLSAKTLPGLAHLAMMGGMVGLMLFRRADYT